MEDKYFGNRLRFLRNERNISAREMSLALGQNETYINKIETGQRSVSMESFFRICTFLKISPADFFDENIKNTTFDTNTVQNLFRKLTPNQAEIVIEIMKELTSK